MDWSCRAAKRRRSTARGPTLNADPASQAGLLDLQALDAALDRLVHRRRTLPELATVAELEARLSGLNDGLVVARTLDSDLSREQTKAEADVDQVRARADRDQQRLDAGQVSSPRELENLQSEIASLGKRRSELEDIVLGVMERREVAQTDAASLATEIEKVGDELATAVARRDELLAEIDAEAASASAARAELAPQLPADLLALYERVRSASGGVGAAALHRGRCEGCHLALNPAELGRFHNAPDDEVLRCEECGRILVRTPESGL